MEPKLRKMAKEETIDEDEQSLKDLEYCLSKTPAERVAEVTRLIQKDLKPGQRMDKTKVNRIRLEDKI